jgi:SAM-dependent methyltransferase
VTTSNVASASLGHPDYWWYRARTRLLQVALGRYAAGAALVLDVGSADGPSVDWLHATDLKVAIDLDPHGLAPGDVCASAMQLPFPDATFDVVGAFDVIEHCEPEGAALSEVVRVLKPGGRLLMSVPAYQWAWTDFDVRSGHHRRYTRGRAVAAVERAGLRVERATHAFAGVFPLFAAERLSRRLTRRSHEVPDDLLPEVSPAVDRLLTRLCRLDERVLARRDLPFGSSVLVAATKPEDA